ncbi:YdcF family protein [Clostridium sp.]|uniref:YdcF family protein n=1 Tax=Clostridium sp. TaxID=1506 RepID=UPI0026289726|nr:YdcF family protein [Clostridium sp.]
MERIKYIIQALWIAFSMPAIILGILILVRHFFRKMMRKNVFLIKVYKIVKIFMCMGFIVFITLEAAIISYHKNNEKKDDYIIVLGAGLDNGRTPNLILSERLDAAIKCEEENPNQYIVLSGGQGTDECVPEAEAMSQYIQERGIDKDKIIIEDKSRDTNENLKFSKEKIEEHSHKPIADVNVKIVTTDFHAFRSSILAKKNGYVNFDNYSSSTIWYFVPSTYIREAFAVVKSAIFDK